MTNPFKPGDRVQDIRGREGVRPIGEIGTVLSCNMEFVRVAFDNPSHNNSNFKTNGTSYPNFVSARTDTAPDAEYYTAITGDTP